MSTPEREESEQFIPISRLKAFALRLWGPADSHDNPLYGTKYDPRLRQQRQHESLEYRRARWERRKQRLGQLLSGRHRHA